MDPAASRKQAVLATRLRHKAARACVAAGEAGDLSDRHVSLLAEECVQLGLDRRLSHGTAAVHRLDCCLPTAAHTLLQASLLPPASLFQPSSACLETGFPATVRHVRTETERDERG